VLFDELLPEQLQGDVLVGFELLVQFGEIGLRLGWLRTGGRRREQEVFQLGFVGGVRRQRPAQLGRGGTFQ
jgi:hypothetical protein